MILQRAEKSFVCSGYFIFVAVDKQGKAILIPELIPKTDQEKRISAEAEQRKQLRLRIKEDSKRMIESTEVVEVPSTVIQSHLSYSKIL